MEDVGQLPERTRSKRERTSRASRGGRTIKPPSTVSSATPRTSLRPSLVSRSSAPLPLARITEQPPFEDNLRAYVHRDSVASIKDDPFFKNYQTPHSVSLARELRSATYANAAPSTAPLGLSIETAVKDNVNLPWLIIVREDGLTRKLL